MMHPNNGEADHPSAPSEHPKRATDGAGRQFHGMTGESRTMRRVFDTIRRVALSDFPVLISGQTGTGKELAARAVHAESRRRKGPFVPVNCGALPETVIESELFGHVPGAFTGAERRRKGRFELADGGTLFLDEVAELSPNAQAKLLRAVQDKRFLPVGAERTVTVDIRLVSATNKDLRVEVSRGRFREDLFYRLRVVPITLPPLSERQEDIVPIARSVLDRVRMETGKPIRSIDEEAVALLRNHAWPGNVRHLISVIQYASILCDGVTVRPEHLPAWDTWTLPNGCPPPPPCSDSPLPHGRTRRAPKSRRKLDRGAVEQALKETNGNRTAAAKRLGIGRATLYRYLQQEEY